MILETDRLILRHWSDSDAEDLYKYACDPEVGPIAGWPAHQSIEESRDVIQNVLSGKAAYAICLKTDNKAIGAIELKLNGHTDMTEKDDECELGYWVGKPFWGQGIVPEAVKEILRHAFEDIGMQKVWVGYYEGNSKSKRVQEKCGFRYQWMSEDVDVPLLQEKRTGHVSCMTKDQWFEDRNMTTPPFYEDHEMKITWHDGFKIYARIDGDTAVISGNKEGLISLAEQLSALAQEKTGAHIHYDEFNSLEEGSSGLIIEKIS